MLNADVDLALDLALDQVVHIVIDHVDGGLSVLGIDIGLNSTYLNHLYQTQIIIMCHFVEFEFPEILSLIENLGVGGGGADCPKYQMTNYRYQKI